MARGKKTVKRLRAKRFEEEIVNTTTLILEALDKPTDAGSKNYNNVKHNIGKMIKRLIDSKVIREQEFYIGDWVCMVNDKGVEPKEIIDINYKLKTARIQDKKEGSIWVKFHDIVKDDDYFFQ
jgi:hypothetical protein